MTRQSRRDSPHYPWPGSLCYPQCRATKTTTALQET